MCNYCLKLLTLNNIDNQSYIKFSLNRISDAVIQISNIIKKIISNKILNISDLAKFFTEKNNILLFVS